MTITDEMVEKAWNNSDSYEGKMRDALEAVYPLIRNQVIEECERRIMEFMEGKLEKKKTVLEIVMVIRALKEKTMSLPQTAEV